MTTPDPLPAKKKLLAQITAAQKQADAAKKAAKRAKTAFKQARQKFKVEKRTAKKRRKELKALKAGLAQLVAKSRPARRPAAGRATKRPRSVPPVASIGATPVAIESVEVSVPADAGAPPAQ